MKSTAKYLTIAAISGILAFAACKKSSSRTTTTLPDASDFSAISPYAYMVGEKGDIQVTSTSLASGTYTVKYHYRDTTTEQSATLVMASHTGNFQTPVLWRGEGATYVTIDSIINSVGSAVITTNNIVTLLDSNGVVTCNFGTTALRGVYVAADIISNDVIVDNYFYVPGNHAHTDIYMQIVNYTAPGTYTLASGNFDKVVFADSSYYGVAGAYVIDTGSYGTLTITSVSPLFAGSYSFTCKDSAKVTGTFSGILP